VLTVRLKDLLAAGIVIALQPSGSALTDRGQDLLRALAPADESAARWARDLPG
jgi:hypothetical protein